MAFHRQEVTHTLYPIDLAIVNQKSFEQKLQPWQFIVMSWDESFVATPKQVKEIGKFLIQEAERVGKEFRYNGTPKVNTK